MTLREMREASGLTQEQAAERAKMSQPAISAIELGRVPNPGIETVSKLAEAYGQPLEAVIAAIREAA
jgi:transcriptional regulator with XRE-family HTH domain